MSEMKYTVEGTPSNVEHNVEPITSTIVTAPSGKILSIVDLLDFCYSVNETATQVFLSILKKRATEEEITNELKISKAAANRALNILLKNSLVKRTKETGQKAGRPRYIYYVDEENITKLINDLEACVPNIKKVLESFIDSMRKFRG